MDNQQRSGLAPESEDPLCDGTTTSTLASSVSQPPSTEKPSGDDSDNRASAELTSSTTSDHDKRTSAEITSTTTSVQDNRTSSTPGENVMAISNLVTDNETNVEPRKFDPKPKHHDKFADAEIESPRDSAVAIETPQESDADAGDEPDDDSPASASDSDDNEDESDTGSDSDDGSDAEGGVATNVDQDPVGVSEAETEVGPDVDVEPESLNDLVSTRPAGVNVDTLPEQEFPPPGFWGMPRRWGPGRPGWLPVPQAPSCALEVSLPVDGATIEVAQAAGSKAAKRSRPPNWPEPTARPAPARRTAPSWTLGGDDEDEHDETLPSPPCSTSSSSPSSSLPSVSPPPSPPETGTP
ncbi:hypothetical protein LTS17_008561 [Exophiala oligosperma]